MSILRLDHVTKVFGGLMAMSDVTFCVEEGSIVGLIGPNGAGKTTVFNCITGNYRPEQGDIYFCEKRITGLAPYLLVLQGIARTFQSIRLFPHMQAVENVLAGRHCRLKSGLLTSMLRTPGQQREEREALDRAMQELAFVGLEAQHAERAGSLSYGNQRLLEIARAMAADPVLLILDEPAGGMNELETADLMRLIRAIRDRGVTVLLIEHDMRLVMHLCERLVVLENGMVIAQDVPEKIRTHPAVIEAYLGVDDGNW